LRIRVIREGDIKGCLAVDASFETESAWQMLEQRREREWVVRFMEVRLPRKQRMAYPLSPEVQVEGWTRRDGFWIAAERRKVLGYVGVQLAPERKLARICELVVDAEQRRQGIGRALLDHASEWAARQGVTQLLLECPPKAQPAIAFALTNNFTICGFQDAYWPGQELALFFRKRL